MTLEWHFVCLSTFGIFFVQLFFLHFSAASLFQPLPVSLNAHQHWLHITALDQLLDGDNGGLCLHNVNAFQAVSTLNHDSYGAMIKGWWSVKRVDSEWMVTMEDRACIAYQRSMWQHRSTMKAAKSGPQHCEIKTIFNVSIKIQQLGAAGNGKNFNTFRSVTALNHESYGVWLSTNTAQNTLTLFLFQQNTAIRRCGGMRTKSTHFALDQHLIRCPMES